MELSELIKWAVSKQWKICVYGLGKIGTEYSEEFLSYLGLKAGLYSDRNKDALAAFNCTDIQKICMDELLMVKEDVLLFLMIGVIGEKSALAQFEGKKNIHIITWTQICNDNQILEKFLGINEFPVKCYRESCLIPYDEVGNMNFNEKIAVYTCITGNYDEPLPILCKEERCDYYLITDIENDKYISNGEYYKKISVNDVVPAEYVTAKDKNRYCKMHGYEIFYNYRYSIYLDGKFQIKGKISEYIVELGRCGLALHKHPFAEDAYVNALRLVIAGRITRQEAKDISDWMIRRQVPRRILYLECGVVVSDHRNPNAQKLLNEWSEVYFSQEVKRDQFYIAYVLWKNGIRENDMGILPGHFIGNDCKYISQVKYHQGIQK